MAKLGSTQIYGNLYVDNNLAVVGTIQGSIEHAVNSDNATNAVNADKVDNLHASSFLRTDADSALSNGKWIQINQGTRVVKTSLGGISGGGDAASSTDANLRIHSWYGVGFAPTIANQTVPQGENATWINVRTGNVYTRGNYYAGSDKPVWHSGNLAFGTGNDNMARGNHGHSTIGTQSISDWNSTSIANGFLQGESKPNAPESSGWFWGFRMQHSGGYGAQIAIRNGGNRMYFRSQDANGTGTWNNVYHTNNKPTAADINALPLSGGTLTGETIFNNYLSLNAWSGYGSGRAQLWYNGTAKELVIQPGAVTNIRINNNLVYHSGNKPTWQDVGSIQAGNWSTNGGQDLRVHGKRALVGTTSGDLYLSYGGDFSNVYVNNSKIVTETSGVAGSANLASRLSSYRATVGNTNVKPYHRIASSGLCTGSFIDKSAVLLISQNYHGGSYCILRLDLRTNGVADNGTPNFNCQFLVNRGFAADAFQVHYDNTVGNTLMDVYYKSPGTYASINIYVLSSGSRGSHDGGFTFMNSVYENNAMENPIPSVSGRTYKGSMTTSFASDGTVSRAGRLSTARTINGTNFDGTGNITTANWGNARTITIGSTGKSVNGSGNVTWTHQEMRVPRTNVNYAFGGNQNAITTAQFITLLTNAGAFEQQYWISRGSWSYASNQYINDTGCGNIHLAGCTIEVIGNASAYTIRIHTPTTSASGVTNGDYIYVNNGTNYSPGWRRLYSDKYKPTAADVGALPVAGGTLTGEVIFNNYLSLNAWSGYGSGRAQLWYNGNAKELVIQPNAVTNIRVNHNLVQHYGNNRPFYKMGDNTTPNVDDMISGIWEQVSSSATGTKPSGINNANSLIAFNSHSGNYGSQIWSNQNRDSILWRNRNNGNWTTWREFLHSGGHVGSQDNTFIAYPNDGRFRTNSNAYTGYLKITLPQSWTDTMMRFTVEIYNYANNSSVEFKVGGYNYVTSSSWINTFAYAITHKDSSYRNLNVRFGHDGSKCAIYIGEANTTWNYPQVTVKDITVGYRSYSLDSWKSGWSVGFTTTLGTITSTISNTFSANGGAARTADALTTARTINGTSFNGTANITTANWGTTRTITIGNTGKSVNGSGNVSWSLNEIGAAAASHTHNVINSRGRTTPASGRSATAGLSTYGYYNSSGPTTYGEVVSFGGGSGQGQSEIAVSWYGVPRMFIRSLRDSTDNWTGWYEVWNSGNLDSGAILMDRNTTINNFDTIKGTGIYMWSNNATSRPPTDYGVVLQWGNRGSNNTPGEDQHWITQFASGTNTNLYYRTRTNGGSWMGWRRVLFDTDLANVSSYKGKIANIGGDGVMEVGQYIDMHNGSSTADYTTRLESSAAQSTHVLRITNNQGWATMGPENTEWCHFNTDRGKFYFSKKIEVNGEIGLYNSPSQKSRFGYQSSSGDTYISNSNDNWFRLKSDPYQGMTWAGFYVAMVGWGTSAASGNKPKGYIWIQY